MALPPNVIEEDRRLDSAATKASEALAKHRWHWTLDETNPDRVSLREYARSVGRSFSTIHAYADGYARFISDRSGAITLDEARNRANMGAESEAATQAVAQARGVSFGHVSKERGTEARRVREIARERAEQRGTTVEEEAPQVAEWVVKSEKATERQKQERTSKVGLRFVEVEGKLVKAKKALTEALELAHEVPWDDEARELLSDTVGNVRALLELIDTALVGKADVDWDSELAKLTTE